ncbi:hypothetical protein [Niallia taxi]|uniref:hypothetical protein n=1 Tax=Niallia taxi TaxID=2499688 RepID=UPI0015F42127|nr:hypothetical protein [Niallia taxi]
MSHISQEIKILSKKWRESVIENDGQISITTSGENYRLLRNGLHFHTFDLEDTQTACKELINMFVGSEDHYYFIAWAAELVHCFEYFSSEEFNISELFFTCVRASLSRLSHPLAEENSNYINNAEYNGQQLTWKSQLIFCHLSFPLLEAVVKKHCKEYVDYNGNVLKDFTVCSRRYRVNPTNSLESNKISNLKHLLHLLNYVVADSGLKNELKEMKKIIKSTPGNNQDPYHLIHSWRNSSLHGSESIGMSRIILHLVILIAIEDIKNKSDVFMPYVKQKVTKRLDNQLYRFQRSPWEYYPPY